MTTPIQLKVGVGKMKVNFVGSFEAYLIVKELGNLTSVSGGRELRGKGTCLRDINFTGEHEADVI